MKSKRTESKKRFDLLKWICIITLFALGVIANYAYSSEPLALRLIGWIILLGVVFLIAAYTTQGQRCIAFAGESRNELLKVVWPNRQETVRSTMIVILMVFLVSIMLWVLDNSLFWAISRITSY